MQRNCNGVRRPPTGYIPERDTCANSILTVYYRHLQPTTAVAMHKGAPGHDHGVSGWGDHDHQVESGPVPVMRDRARGYGDSPQNAYAYAHATRARTSSGSFPPPDSESYFTGSSISIAIRDHRRRHVRVCAKNDHELSSHIISLGIRTN